MEELILGWTRKEAIDAMSQPRYPSLFQINTRVHLTELSTALGRPATLDDIPDSELERYAADGFDLLWFLGVWQTGETGRRISASLPGMRAEYQRALPDLQEALIFAAPVLRSMTITFTRITEGTKRLPACASGCAVAG